MAKKQLRKGKRRVPKTVLRLPDLGQEKSAVLNRLSSIDAQRGYRHAIEEFAVRRLAYEASDCGLLSPDLAVGIRHVKGVKKIGVRLGNWLTLEQSQRLWNALDAQTLEGKRDRALLVVLLACGLRRHEAVCLGFGHLQQREDHWAIIDLKGKAGHTRTIPMPGWVKALLDE